MVLACGCYDFDYGEHDSWVERLKDTIPPSGSKCCECNAPLTDGAYATFAIIEKYAPDEVFHEFHEWSQLHGDDLDEYERQLDEFRDKHGWDSESEDYTKETVRRYRCDRCQGLAEAYEGLGYCFLGLGEVIEANVEYSAEHGREVKWKRDKNGVWNPKRRE
jgi:hypothetical protein